MSKRKETIVVTIILVILTIISIVPFAWMISTSLKTNGALMAIPIEWIPKEVSFKAYEKIFTKLPFARSVLNSIIITVSSTLIVLTTSSMAAYIFAKFDFKFKNVIFTLFLASMMIPIQVTGIPLFVIMAKLNLLNTYGGVISPSIFNVFAIFLLRQHMQSLPNAYIEAAVIDGASFMQVFRKVVLPLSVVPMTTLFVMNFMNYWNDYYWPLLVLSEEKMMTLPVILSKMNSQYATEYNTLMAGALVSMIPILLVYIFAQKYFIKGIEEGGIK